jgi:SpoVK/Ycf46/Vps4 family AAA+-type ATPase
MEKLFETNAGLRGRIPHKLHFPNYSREELFEIFKMKAEKKHECDEALLKNVQEFFNNLDDEFIKSDEFGNARFVRNLIERLRVKALLRLQGDFQPEPGQRLPLIATDLECALMDEDIKGINKKEKRRRIGFYAENTGLQV